MNSYQSNNSTSRSNLGKEKCKNCNQPISRGAPICFHCGSIQEQLPISKESQTRLQKMVKELFQNYNNLDINVSSLFNKSALRYANACARIQALLKNEALQNSGFEDIMERLDKVDSLCKTREYSIAFVGNIKAGKSSLINEFLKCDLASVNTVPETAALTKFRSSEDGLKLTLTFYTRKEWETIWKDAKGDDKNTESNLFVQKYQELNAESIKDKYLDNEPKTFIPDSFDEMRELLTKWTSAQSPEHYFVKEVEVQLNNLNLPADVVIVDTPGLDDVIPYRSNLTRHYIKKANAVVVCIKCESYGAVQHDFIARNIANTVPENVFVLCTQIDLFNHPVEEWDAHRKQWLSYLKTKGCFGDKDLAKQRIFGISSYILKLLRQYDEGEKKLFFTLRDKAYAFGFLTDEQMEMSRKEIEDLFAVDGSVRKKLVDISGVNKLWTQLKTEIFNNYQTRFLDELVNAWKKCNNNLICSMKQTQEGCDNVIKTYNTQLSEKKQLVQDLKKKQKLLEAELQNDNWSDFERQIRKEFDELLS